MGHSEKQRKEPFRIHMKEKRGEEDMRKRAQFIPGPQKHTKLNTAKYLSSYGFATLQLFTRTILQNCINQATIFGTMVSNLRTKPKIGYLTVNENTRLYILYSVTYLFNYFSAVFLH